MVQIDHIMGKFVTVMSLLGAQIAIKNVGSGCAPRRNAVVTTMLWQILIGNALTCHMIRLHVMMKKKEQVAGCTGVAPDLQHARAALPVCVLAVKSVDFQTAVARLALISPGMQKLK